LEITIKLAQDQVHEDPREEAQTLLAEIDKRK